MSAPVPLLRGLRRRRAGAAAGSTLLAIGCALFTGCSAGGIDVIDIDPNGLASGLLAHWSFDDGAGSVLTDRSINQRNGQILNGTWIEGRFGGALHFVTAGEVSVPSFPQPIANWSVAGWVRPPAGDLGPGYQTLISTELPLMGGWQMNARLTVPTVDAPVGRLYQFAYWVGPNFTDYMFFNCECVADNEWTHLAAVVDVEGGKMSFYRNGASVGEKLGPAMTMLPRITAGSSTLYLARWPPDLERNLTADLDDFVVYDRALAAREVEALWRVGVPKPY